ncbi:hypothetical protein Sjap_014602 [Stephania japonica]|uniref:Uncharacterized protein n=1 Tax=Stephania japonica TaxID=461633 RepID=A0AAP0II03_9MAGN
MDGRSTIPSRDETSGIVIRSPQATVSLEDRLTAQEVRMMKYSRILRDQGAAIFEMVASLTTEPSSDNDFTRGYMREMIDRDLRVPRGGRASFGASTRSRGTRKLETRRPVVRQRGSTGAALAMVGLCGCVVGLRRPPEVQGQPGRGVFTGRAGESRSMT